MQSTNLTTARALRDAYTTEHERDAFEAGYNHAHGIACQHVPQIGDGVDDHESPLWPCYGIETVEDARDHHAFLCYAAEENARCYSPWEHTAHEINQLGEWEAEAAWEAYEAGVAAAIEHDLAGYTDADYGAEEDAPTLDEAQEAFRAAPTAENAAAYLAAARAYHDDDMVSAETVTAAEEEIAAGWRQYPAPEAIAAMRHAIRRA